VQNLSLEHQLLTNVYQAINAESEVLFNFPNLSYFDLNFSSLENKMENQFAKIEDNEFLVRNFNRILEMLSELHEFFPILLKNNTFQELALNINNNFDNMENILSSNFNSFQTLFQKDLVSNLNPVINFLPNFNQMLKILFSLENKLSGFDIESLNQVPKLLTTTVNKILNKMNPMLTLDNFLVNHNALMSFIQNNVSKNDTTQDALFSFLVTHFGDINLIMENILSIMKNNVVNISYMEEMILPLFNSIENSLIPKISGNMLWLTEQFPLFSSLISNKYEDLKSFLESQHFLSPLIDPLNNGIDTILSNLNSKFPEITSNLNSQQSSFFHQFQLLKVNLQKMSK
jgi:hypothetical protein